MIRICYTVDAMYAGGAERYVELLVDAIDRRRFEPCILGRDTPGMHPWLAAQREKGLAVREVAMNLPFRPGHVPGIVGALRELAPEIVHINMPGPYDGQMALLAPLARFAGARAVITTEHLPMVAPLWKRALVKRLGLRWADRVLTVSQANVDYLTGLHRIAPDRIEVVYNGIANGYGSRADRAAARRQFRMSPGAIAVVIVGNLSERKGLGPLLEALAGVEGEWQLFVAGDGPDRDRFTSRAAQLGIASRVFFLGPLEPSQVEVLLGGADLLALPSFMEGLPYVIVEAMACALPVVASDVYGIPEAARHGETALLVPPGDVESLRQALMELMANPDLRAKLGANGRRRFESLFTLDRHIARMEAIYMELIEGVRHG